MENRVEFCCHTKMSTLQGINSAREYIQEAINRGDKAIAITDTDSTQSFFDANNYLRLYSDNKDFKIIYGAEMHFKISENTDKLYSIYIYVKKQKDIKNFVKEIIDLYIEKYKLGLIVVTNVKAVKYIKNAIEDKNEKNCMVEYKYIDKKTKTEKMIPIIFSGYLANGMDQFSKIRLKNDIKKYYDQSHK